MAKSSPNLAPRIEEEIPSQPNLKKFIEVGDQETLREKFKRWLANFGVITVAVLLILMLRSCLLGYFFPGAGIGKKLATLSYLFNQVVHRNGGEASFSKASLDQVLFENDALRTYENSHAEVTFIGGGLIKIDENTLIVLRSLREGFGFGESRFALFLEQGHMLFNLKPNEEIFQIIRTAFGDVRLHAKAGANGARFSVEIQPDGKAKITVYSGEATIEINGQVLIVNQNQFVLIDENLQPIVALLPASLILIHPDQEPIIFTRRFGQEVTFEWNAQEPQTALQIEIAQDEGFQKMVAQSVTKNSFYTERIMGPGTYYWRVGKVGSQIWDNQGLFYMVYLDPTAWEKILLDPQRNVVDEANQKTTIYFQADYPLVTFSWNPVKGASSYRLEVYSDADFQEVLLAQDVEDTTFSTKPGFLRDTHYFWQVIAKNERDKPIAVTDVLELQLIYDNALPYLTIFSPDEGEFFRALSAPVSGALPEKASLLIQGQGFAVSNRGKFRSAISLPKGTSQVVFRAVTEDGRIEYHARTVTVF